jgi:hypothetical protein
VGRSLLANRFITNESSVCGVTCSTGLRPYFTNCSRKHDLSFSSFLIKHHMFFYYKCRFMESQGILDSDNEVDLYCLHLVFVPYIQTFMDEFRDSWNRHPVRTAPHSSSPNKLFTLGMQALRNVAEEKQVKFTELEQVT